MDTIEGDSQTTRALLHIRELIVQGEFKAGERIREAPLAERLAVSRTPLRLALDRLAHEGLLEMRPKGGFVVRQFSVQDLLDAIDLRGVLEGTAARWASERWETRTEVDPLYDCIAETHELLQRSMTSVELIRQYSEINERFHTELLNLAKSPTLAQAVAQVMALPFSSPNAFVFAESESEDHRDALLISNSQHEAIADAIADREGARAEAVAWEHSRIVRRSVRLALEEKRINQIPGGSLIQFPHAG